MDPFSLSVVQKLAATLVYEAGKSTFLLATSAQREALEAVFRDALAYAIKETAGHLDGDVRQHLQGLLADFLRAERVSSLLVESVIALDTPPTGELETHFNALGFDSTTIPVSFAALMQSLGEGMSNSLRSELAKDSSPLASSVNSRRLELLLEGSRNQTQSMRRQEMGLQSLRQDTSDGVEKRCSLQQGTAETPGKGTIDLDVQLTTAKDYLRNLNLSAASATLEGIRQQNWNACSNDYKCRVLSLLARISELESDQEKAASLRLEAGATAEDPRQKKLQKAYAYASQGDKEKVRAIATNLIEEAPGIPDGWNLWAQSLPDEMPLEEIVSRIPMGVREDTDVLAGLSACARARGEYEKAEQFAREALARLPKSPLAHLYLALTLIQKYDGQLPQETLSEPVRLSIAEAEALLRDGLRLAGANPPKQIEIGLRYHRAITLRMLGRTGEALEELARLSVRKPKEDRVVFEYARLLVAERRADDAIRVLEEHLDSNTSDVIATLLIELYLAKATPAYEAAFQVAHRALAISEQDAFERVILLHHCITMAHQVKDLPLQEEFAAHAKRLPRAYELALHAECELLGGHEETAQGLMREVADSLAGGTDKNVRRYVAQLLERGELYREALDMWRSMVAAGSVTDDTFALLACAKKCKNLSDITRICQSVREKGILLIPLYDYELAARWELQDLQEATRLTECFLGVSWDDRVTAYLRFQLSQLGVVQNMPELCERDVNRLPAVNDVYPDLGETVAKLLYAMGENAAALEYAYRLYRRFPGEVQSHRALLAGLLYGSDFGVRDYMCVEAGCAVEYKTPKGDRTEWIVLENEPEPDMSRSEFGPGHALYQAVLGKAVGDRFVLQHGKLQTIEAEIVRIISKCQFRVQESLRTMPQLFGAEAGFEMVCLEGTEPGTVDLDPLFRSLDAHQEGVTAIVQGYREKPIPIVVLSRLLESGLTGAMASLRRETGARIFCCQGTNDEYRKAAHDLSTSAAIVLDATAIATLLLSGNLELLLAQGMKPLVTEGVLLDLREEARDSQSLLRSEGSLTKSEGKYGLVHIERSQREAWCNALADAASFLEEHCRIIPGSVALVMPAARRETFSKILPHSSIETLALCSKDGHTLWTDDGRFFMLACGEFGTVRRVWTQLVARECVETGRFSAVDEAKLSAAMFGLGFVDLRVHSGMIAYLLTEGLFSSVHPSIRLLLDLYRDIAGEPRKLLQYTCMLLREIWQKCLVDSDATGLCDEIFGILQGLPRGIGVIQVIAENLQSIFGVDVVGAERCRRCLKTWINLHVL